MLVPLPEFHLVGLIKPNQTKSNLRGVKKFTAHSSMFEIQ